MMENNQIFFTDEKFNNKISNEIADILNETEYKYQITSSMGENEKNAIIKIRDEELKNSDLIIFLKIKNPSREKAGEVLATIIGPNGFDSIRRETMIVDYADENYIISLILRIISSYLFT